MTKPDDAKPFIVDYEERADGWWAPVKNGGLPAIGAEPPMSWNEQNVMQAVPASERVLFKGGTIYQSKYGIQCFHWDRYQDDIGHYFFVKCEGRGDVAACVSNEAAYAALRLMMNGER